MTPLIASVPPEPNKHPLLVESNTELLSLRIPRTMQFLLKQKVESIDSTVNNEVRFAIAEYLQPTPKPQPTQLVQVQPTLVQEPVSEENTAVNAFENTRIIKAIQSVARNIEDGTIECSFRGIVDHFLSFCPIIKA